MKSALIIVGVVLAAVALGDARSPPRPQVCTMDWRPVCGVDNKTYGNACMARAKYVDSTELYLFIMYNEDIISNVKVSKLENRIHLFGFILRPLKRLSICII